MPKKKVPKSPKSKPQAHTVSCPRCGLTSSCGLAEDVMFSVVHTVNIIRPLHQVGGYAMADLDGEEIEQAGMKPMLICSACNAWLPLPAWMEEHVLVAERYQMTNNPGPLMRTAKEAIRAMKEKGQSHGKNASIR